MGDEFVRDLEWLEPSREAQWEALEAIRARAEETNQRLNPADRPPSAATFEATTTDRSRLERASVEELRAALQSLSLEPNEAILWAGRDWHDAISLQIYARFGDGPGVMNLRISGSNLREVDAVRADLDRWWRVARANTREVPYDWGFTPIEDDEFELVRRVTPQKARASKWRAFWGNAWVVGTGVTVVGGLILTGVGVLLARLFGG